MRRRSRTAWGTLLLAVALPAASRAQDAGPAPPSCGERRAGHSAVTGVVRDSASAVALPGAQVTFMWDTGPGSPAGQATTRTTHDGSYLVCGIPTSTPVTLSSTFPRRRAEAIVSLPEEEIVRLDFRLVPAGSNAEEEEESRVATLETAVDGEASVVVGSVWDLETQAPLVGAQVSLVGSGRGTVSEAGGGFRLSDVQPGTHRLRIEHLGYAPAEAVLDLDEPKKVSIAARLSPAAIAMEAIEARARVRASLEEEERAYGDVRYRIGREEFEKRPTASLAAVIRSRAPGVRYGMDSRGCPVFSTRSGRALVVVDGVPYRDGCVLAELSTVSVESVAVLSAAAASTLYGSLGGGGVIEVETRRR